MATQSTRRTRLSVALVAAIIVLTALPVAASADPAASGPVLPGATPWAFRSSSIEGAGFVNVIAHDPHHPGTLLAGGDVSGLHRSTDGGQTWAASNRGITRIPELSVAAIAYSPTVPDLIYAAVGGKNAAGGALLVSEDGGASWSSRSREVTFSGANNFGHDVLPAPHPRSTGQLLVVADDGTLYAGTFDDGVHRSTDGGRSWKHLGLRGRFIRGMAADRDRLYVAAWDGVHVITDADGAARASHLTDSPARVEEIAVDGATVVAVAGKAGIWRSTDRGGTWSRQHSDGGLWMSVTTGVDAGRTVWYAGSDDPPRQGSRRDSVIRSRDGGRTWSPVTGPGSVSTDVGGPGGDPWWFAKDNGWAMIGQGGFTAAQITVSPHDGRHIGVSGRSGIWGTRDGAVTWHPWVRGLGVTVNQDVTAVRGPQDQWAVANTDWVTFASGDDLNSHADQRPPKGNTAFSIVPDSPSNEGGIVVAVGDRDHNKNGEIYSNRDHLRGGRWVSEGFLNATGGRRPFGAVVGEDTQGRRVLVVASDGDGVWRRVGNGPWRRSGGTAMRNTPANRTAPLAWAEGTDTVYLYDAAQGLYRSNDAGASFSLISATTSNRWLSGFMALDPTDPGRVYISRLNREVWRLDGADGPATHVRATRLDGVSSPGPLVVAPDGTVIVTGNALADDVALWVSGDHGDRWVDVADDAYRAAAGFPWQIAMAEDGTLVLALFGNGAIVGDVLDGIGAVSIGTKVPTTTAAPDVTEPPVTVAPTTAAPTTAAPTTAAPTTVAPTTAAPTTAAPTTAAPTTAAPTTVAPPAGEVDQTPTVRWSRPATGSTGLAGKVTLTGISNDDRAVAEVQVSVKDRGTGQWLRADGSWGRFEWVDARAARPGSHRTTWSLPIQVPAGSRFFAQVRAVDDAGQISEVRPSVAWSS